jgi:hypothetical protein
LTSAPPHNIQNRRGLLFFGHKRTNALVASRALKVEKRASIKGATVVVL